MASTGGRKRGSVAKSAGEWRPVFLKALRMLPVVRLACDTAGVSRKTAYQWRDRNAAFRKSWDEAIEDGIDMIEGQLHARARKSDTIAAIFLLKSLRRRIYADRLDVDVSGTLTVDEVSRAKQGLADKMKRIKEALAGAN
jgi:hypothetical protein